MSIKNLFPASLSVRHDQVGARVDRFLKSAFPGLSHSTLQKLLRQGKVRLNGKRTKADARLAKGDTFVFSFILKEHNRSENSPWQESLNTPQVQKMLAILDENLLWEDDDLMVFNKPAGLSVQAGVATSLSMDRLLVFRARGEYAPRLTHRLDRDTSGVIVFAKSRECAAYLTQAFKERTIEKTYWAIVVGAPSQDEGVLDAPLGKDTGPQQEKMSSHALEVKDAVTRYRVLAKDEMLSFLELNPETGRKHQIRVHCAEAGFPILGDGKYGGAKAHPLSRRVPICLHARRLSFVDAGGLEHTFEAPVPQMMESVLIDHDFVTLSRGDY